MSQDIPRVAGQAHAAAGVTSWYLHEVSFQETFTRRNVMTAHKTKVAGLGPVQRRSLQPECIATLCKALPHCAEMLQNSGVCSFAVVSVQLVWQVHRLDLNASVAMQNLQQ